MDEARAVAGEVDDGVGDLLGQPGLRAHGIDVDAENYSSITPQIPEVKLASIGAEQAFALASPGWSQPLPTGLTWIRLRDDPLIRRTWAVWDADSRNQDLATLVSILEDLSNSTSPFSRPASDVS